MTYTSIAFYIFLFVVLFLYYVVPLRFRWIILLMGSAVFYLNICKDGWWILLLSIVVSYLSGMCMHYLRKKYSLSLHWLKKSILIISLIMIVLPWFCIKNGNFILNGILHKSSISWIVPVGISFYTLQMISYLVDIYCGRIDVQKNIAKYALFVLFFPQIIQGPIPRYEELAKQLYQGHAFDENKFVKGILLILWGFFKKFLIADKSAVVVNEVFGHPDKYAGYYIFVAAVLYSIELYTDFMACTIISKGVAELFGIYLTDNFKHPYFAVSIKDFWRRWHISLSSWLRDYIYIPLGGSRKGKAVKYINLAITFVVSGIWHGAGYKFLFWGLLHAGYQIAGELTAGMQNAIYNFLKLSEQSVMRKALQRIGVFFWVMLAWIVFRADRLVTGVRMIKSMFLIHNPWIFFNDKLFSLGLCWKEWGILLVALVILVFVGCKQEQGINIRKSVLSMPIYLRWFLYISVILCIMFFGTYGFGFDAQDFIYGGF